MSSLAIPIICSPDDADAFFGRGGAARAVFVDPGTGACAALVRPASGRAAAYCSACAPKWVRRALEAAGALYVAPRPQLKFSEESEKERYENATLRACTFGAAAHFAAQCGVVDAYQGPSVTLRLGGAAANSCFARAVLLCLREAGGAALWEREPAGGSGAVACVSDLPAAHEATARGHLRECLRQFDSSPEDERLVAAALLIVGRVMRAAAERAPDLSDGRQHDAQEFALRLLRALGHEPAFSTSPGLLEFAAGPVVLADVREAGAAPACARAVVAYAGNAASGHYTAHGRGGGGWTELPRGSGSTLGGRVVLTVSPRR